MTFDDLARRARRDDVIRARNRLELTAALAVRYRRVMRALIAGTAVFAAYLLLTLVAIVLSAWVDFGSHVVFVSFLLSVAGLGLGIGGIVIVHDSNTDDAERTPQDLHLVARRAYDEAYAAYLATEPPLDPADAFLEPVRR